MRDLAILIDREQGGVEELERRGINCHAAFGLSELLRLYLDADEIDREIYQRTMHYIEHDQS